MKPGEGSKTESAADRVINARDRADAALRERGDVDLSECYIDGTFIVAKKGGLPWVPPSGAKARNSWSWQTLPAFPSARATSASPAEVSLVQATLEAHLLAEQPTCLIGDKAYDSDPLDAQLATQGVEMITPHQRGRTKPKTQDGRALRRYRRRWKVERLLLGCETSGASSPVTNARPRTTSASSISAASRFCFAAIYETASRH